MESESPTAAPNDCQKIAPGDIAPFLINSDNPDSVTFFPFDDLPAGLELFLTDNAWNGLAFQNDEGTVKVGSFYVE